MKAAVTGVTGFLGSNLARQLLAEGWTVSGLARDPEKARSVPPKIRVVIGDICDVAALDELVRDADVVFHTVSNFRTSSGPPDSYRQINVEGTRAVLDAARRAKVGRLVHCSTIGVHGDVKVTPASEDAPFAPGDLYQVTKLEAEELVRAAAAESAHPEIVIIRPCSLYGPGDLRMLKMFRMLEKGTFLKVGPCSENFHAAYIDDVTRGFVVAATTPGIHGQVYFLGGPDYVPLDEYIDTAARAVGASTPKLRLPYGLMFAAAWLCERVCVPLRIEPPLHVRRVRFFKNNRAFSISKARSQLDWEPQVDLESGMRRTVAWYREQGLLSPAATASS